MVPLSSKHTRRQRSEKPHRGPGPGPGRALLDHHAKLGRMCEGVTELFPRQEESNTWSCDRYDSALSVSSSDESTVERPRQQRKERSK
jgi:hypothetical protein